MGNDNTVDIESILDSKVVRCSNGNMTAAEIDEGSFCIQEKGLYLKKEIKVR